MREIKFLDLPNQYRTIQSEIDTAVAAVLKAGDFIGGEAVKRFETAFANLLGPNIVSVWVMGQMHWNLSLKV